MLGLLLSSCSHPVTRVQTDNYEDFIRVAKEKQMLYFAQAAPSILITEEGLPDAKFTTMFATHTLQETANSKALEDCVEAYKNYHTACVVVMEGLNMTPEAKNFIAMKKREVAEEKEEKEREEEKKKVKISSMINKAKSTCKELGFAEGTEKFADCALKLYSQEIELAAEKNQTVIMQPQSSGSNSITIYDPVRDSNALINKGMRMINNQCTFGVNC